MANSSIFINAGSNVLPITTSNSLRITYSDNSNNPYYIFERTDLVSAPVVVFLHGYSVTPPDPKVYGGWIKNLLDNGNSVIYPLYYQSHDTNTAGYTANAETAIQSAYAKINESGHTVSNGSISVIGHSLGCIVGMNFANDTTSLSLPNPQAILLANTADANVIVSSFTPIQYSSYSGIDSSAQIMFIVGDDDLIAGTTDSITIYNKLTQLSNKWLATLFSASHLTESITSNHFAPLSNTSDNTVSGSADSDQLDTGGYWFLFNSLQAASQASTILNPGSSFSLGTWTDTTPITPLETIVTGPTL